jgi:adenine phosphoribosyltransferase/phosphomevalonate kinase
MTLRAHRGLQSIMAQDTEYILHDTGGSQIATSYSRVAQSLPNSACLDGFIFWSSHDTLSIATSFFDSKPKSSQQLNGRVSLPLEEYAKVCCGQTMICKPSELFDRELYMTTSFKPDQVVPPGSGKMPPNKLRSTKRCILLPTIDSIHESILFNALRTAATKWCYVHILHGGGAVRTVQPTETAFGCRHWDFAVVITARWPDGDSELENAATTWLRQKTMELRPHAAGVYGSDLGPADSDLSSFAFGPNTPRLATIKREHDPLNILRCGCPLTGKSGYNDPRTQRRGVVVIFCGRRCVGKDWLANIALKCLNRLIDDETGTQVAMARISDETKRAFAEENLGVDANKLIYDRSYKEKYRKPLTAFYNKMKVRDLSFDARCFAKIVQTAPPGILLLTGMRDGLHYVRSLAGRSTILVKVGATAGSKVSRGWVYDPDIDESSGECAADAMPEDFWDLCYDNSEGSTVFSAEDWVKRTLIPCILKGTIRHLPDFPQTGVVYKDLIGGLLLQPFALPLCTSLVIDWLRTSKDATQEDQLPDAILVPATVGIPFATAVALRLNKPLILARKRGSLPGDVCRVSYDGSNMNHLMGDERKVGGFQQNTCSLEVVKGSISIGQRILIVDDCLASGSTLDALVRLVAMEGGVVEKFVCIMELVDLNGRHASGVDYFSLLQFSGN